jgi:hypothetical protein
MDVHDLVHWMSMFLFCFDFGNCACMTVRRKVSEYLYGCVEVSVLWALLPYLFYCS